MKLAGLPGFEPGSQGSEPYVLAAALQTKNYWGVFIPGAPAGLSANAGDYCEIEASKKSYYPG